MRLLTEDDRGVIREALRNVSWDQWTLFVMLGRYSLEQVDSLLAQVIADRIPLVMREQSLSPGDSLFLILNECGLDFVANPRMITNEDTHSG